MPITEVWVAKMVKQTRQINRKREAAGHFVLSILPLPDTDIFMINFFSTVIKIIETCACTMFSLQRFNKNYGLA